MIQLDHCRACGEELRWQAGAFETTTPVETRTGQVHTSRCVPRPEQRYSVPDNECALCGATATDLVPGDRTNVYAMLHCRDCGASRVLYRPVGHQPSEGFVVERLTPEA